MISSSSLSKVIAFGAAAGVASLVDQAPPLSEAVKARLATLLRPTVEVAR